MEKGLLGHYKFYNGSWLNNMAKNNDLAEIAYHLLYHRNSACENQNGLCLSTNGIIIVRISVLPITYTSLHINKSIKSN